MVDKNFLTLNEVKRPSAVPRFFVKLEIKKKWVKSLNDYSSMRLFRTNANKF